MSLPWTLCQTLSIVQHLNFTYIDTFMAGVSIIRYRKTVHGSRHKQTSKWAIQNAEPQINTECTKVCCPFVRPWFSFTGVSLLLFVACFQGECSDTVTYRPSGLCWPLNRSMHAFACVWCSTISRFAVCTDLFSFTIGLRNKRSTMKREGYCISHRKDRRSWW